MLMKVPVPRSTATARARAGKCGLGGLCLAFSRGVYTIPAKWLSADLDWQNATYKVVQTTTKNMPVGAFIHMWAAFSKYQHIAIYLGNGLMATTDSNRRCTYIATVSSWQRAGYKIRGWAADCNGYVVPELKAVYDKIKSKKPAKPKPGKIAVDGKWGPETKKAWQRVLGTPDDGIISKPYSQMVAKIQKALGLPDNGKWDKKLTKALQKRYGTPQDGKTSPVSRWVMELQKQLNEGRW